MRNNLTICVFTDNSEYWLDATLPQMINNSERVVIIDGNVNGTSFDDTLAIARQYMRRNDRLRGRAFQSVREKYTLSQMFVDTTHFMYMDADEAFLPNDWKRIQRYVQKGIHGVRFGSIHLWKTPNYQLYGSVFSRHNRYLLHTGIQLNDNGKPINCQQIRSNKTLKSFHYMRVSPTDVYQRWQCTNMGTHDGWLDDREHPELLPASVHIAPYTGGHPLEDITWP